MARRTSTTSSGATLSRTTTFTQVSTINPRTGSRSQTQASSGSTMVYPVSDYSGMNTLVRDPVYSSATTGSIIINISSSNTTAPQSSDCPQVRSIVDDTVTLVGADRQYTFTFRTGSADVAAVARITPTATSAVGYIGITDKPDHNTKITLVDTSDNKVVYAFDTSSAHYDGRVNGSNEVIVGLSGIRTGGQAGADDSAARLLAAINATTEYSNSLTLNITAVLNNAITTAALSSLGRSNVLKLTQDTPGKSGNRIISIPTSSAGTGSGRIYGMPFEGGDGLLAADLHGTTLTFQDVAGTIYAATCSAGDAATTSFTFSAVSVSGSTIQLESARGAKMIFKAVGDCDEISTGQSERINLASTSSVPTVFYIQGTSSAESAVELKKAIDISYVGQVSASISNSTVTLTQQIGGTSGNTTVTTGGNFTNSVSGGSVSNFTGGTNFTKLESTAVKIGVSSLTSSNDFAAAIHESLDQARAYGVLSNDRNVTSGSLLAINSFSVSPGANGYIDVTQTSAGQTGNVEVGGTLILNGHAATDGFVGGVNSVDATASPQSTTTLATTLAAAINSKASASFSASVIASTTNSSGDTIGRVQVGLRTFGTSDDFSYVTSSQSGTTTFSNVSEATGTIRSTHAFFGGAQDEDFSSVNDILSGGAQGSYDLQNLSDTPYINSKASEIFGFNPHPMENDADYFNNLMLNRNGPYGYPMWKQIQSDNKIVIQRRKKNIFSNILGGTKRFNAYDPQVWSMNPSSPPLFPGEGEHISLLGENQLPTELLDLKSLLPAVGLDILNLRYYFKSSNYFYEPPVVIRHNPFEYLVDNVTTMDGDLSTAVVRSTLFNGLHFFTNPGMNENYRISDADAKATSIYGIPGRNKELYSFFHAAVNEVSGRDFKLKEQIFPKEISTFRPLSREKANYEEFNGYSSNGMHRRLSLIRSFWRNDKCDRIRPITQDRIGGTRPPYSSIGYAWNLPWSTTGHGYEMSHGLYSKPNLKGLAPDFFVQMGQPFFGAGIAIWYYNEDIETSLNGLGVPVNHPHVYGVGLTQITCSVIIKTTHPSEIEEPDLGFDGIGDFVDPTPIATCPGYSAFNFVGPAGDIVTSEDINRDWIVDQKMTHQPYDFSLLSMWPLDWPAHIAVPDILPSKSPFVMTEEASPIDAGINGILEKTWMPYSGQYSLGHVCLGLAPNRLGTPYLCDGQTFDQNNWNTEPNPGFGIGQDNWPNSNEAFLKAGETVIKPVKVFNQQTQEWEEIPLDKMQKKITYGPSFRTGAAGELIYSTKPTITLYNRTLPDTYPDTGLYHKLLNVAPNNADPGTDLYMWTGNPHHYVGVPYADKAVRSDTTLGYRSSTASFQYLRHTWPYFQPLWRLDELTGRAPMHNSYADFVSDITPMSRDYSILPEFRISNKQQEYDEILSTTLQKRYPIYIVTEDGHIRRNVYKPVPHVADFLSIDGVRASHTYSEIKLDEGGQNYATFHSKSAETSEFPNSQEINSYEALTDKAVALFKQQNEEKSWRTDPKSVEFYERYSHTETCENFSKLIQQDEKGFAADKHTTPSKIKLSFRGIKKLLPFKDFYPVNRTITMGSQIVDVFSSSMSYDSNIYSASLLYTSSIPGVGVVTGAYPNSSTLAAAATQSFIEPLFAPGIMFNSIKSGIAVSYPVYAADKNPQYFGNPNTNTQFGPYAEATTASVTVTNQADGDEAVGASIPLASKTDTWQYSHDPKEFIGHGYGSMMGVASAMPTFLMNKFNYQLPFEAIYDLNQLSVMSKFKTYMVDDFIDVDRAEHVEGSEKHPHSWTVATGSIVIELNDIGQDAGGGDATEVITITNSAFPSIMSIQISASSETNSTVTSSATIAGNLLQITYPRGQGAAERRDIIANAINLHCTASDDWNNALFQPYFVSSSLKNNLNKQILTASAYGAKTVNGPKNYIKIRSAHSFLLEQQRIIRYSVFSTTAPPASGSLVVVSGSNTNNTITESYLYNGFFSGSSNRQVAQHQFKPHVVLDDIPNLQDSFERRRYESSMNNFLAETVNFFIEKDSTMTGRYHDLKMPIAISKPQDQIEVLSGVEYYMTVNLYMGENHVMCEGPRFADVPNIRDNASASMRGAFFGPPMEVVHRSSGSLNGPSGSEANPKEASKVMLSPLGSDISPNTGYTTEQQGLIDNITDPAYHHVTPPYFYGPSSIVLKYKATSNTTSVEEIFQTAKEQSLYVEEYTTGLPVENIAGYNDNRFPNSSLCPKIPTAESVSTGSVARMKIESSLNIFGKGGTGTNQVISVSPLKSAHDSAREGSVWVMLPKWVCPVLDFGLPTTIVRDVERYTGLDSKAFSVKFKNTTPFYDVLSGRSMWMGYGFDPYNQSDKKIMEMHLAQMELVYSAGQKAANLVELEEQGLATVITDPSQNADSVHKKGIWFQLSEQFPESFQGQIADSVTFATETDFPGAATTPGYVTNRSDVFSSENTASLMQLLGFDEATGTSPLPIGKIASQKTISEAIVAIPYFEEPWWIDSKRPGTVEGVNESTAGYNIDQITNEARQDGYVLRSVAGTLKSAIIPGKYFLKVDTFLFQNMLNLLLVDRLTSPGTEDNDNLRSVFKDYERSLAAVNRTDLGNTLKTLLGIDASAPLGYMMPPEFDFVNNSAVPAFQMVVAPFSHSLDRTDLMNIWQNLMPDVSLRASKVKTDVILNPGTPAFGADSHADLLGDQILAPGLRASNPGQFLNTNALRPQVQGEYMQDWQYGGNCPKSSAEFFEKLRWMVFKVKQRAAHDYEEYTRRQIDLALNKQDMRKHGTYTPLDTLSTTEIYGSNWPYDYFSLIEKAKLDIEYEVSG